MRYWIRTDKGYISAVGTGHGGEPIAEAAYEATRAKIAGLRALPEAPEGFIWRLRADTLNWEMTRQPEGERVKRFSGMSGDDFRLGIYTLRLEDFDLTTDADYLVTLDGTEYPVTAWEYTDGVPIAGNAVLFGGEDSGEPFLIADYGGVGDGALMLFRDEAPTYHSLSVETVINDPAQMPE